MTLDILRYMAWERAKGELNSMLQTFINDDDKYDELEAAIKDFIADIEDNAKYE